MHNKQTNHRSHLRPITGGRETLDIPDILSERAFKEFGIPSRESYPTPVIYAEQCSTVDSYLDTDKRVAER